MLLALTLAAGAFALAWALKPDPAVLASSLQLIDFQGVAVGDAADQSFEVVNRGESELIMLRTDLGGADAADFAVSSDECSGGSLAAGERCLVEVAFRPSARGRRAATLSLVGEAINAPVSLPLLGHGTAAELRVEPTAIAFPPALLGTLSPPVRVRAANRGTTSLRVAEISIEGLAAGDFALRHELCRGRTLAPNAECTADVVFLPTREGARRATLRLRGETAEQALAVRLEGEGILPLPSLRLAAERLDLGVVAVGEPGNPISLEILNDGSAPLEIEAIALGGADSERFVIDVAPCADTPVAAGDSCSIRVRASPVAVGPLAATVTIHHAGGFGEVAIVATGIAPQVRLVPLRIGLGESPLDRKSDPSPLRIENVGMVPLRVGSVVLRGGDADSFEISSDSCGGSTLGSGEACTLRVAVHPRRPGPLRTTLVVSHNAGDEKVPVTAFGVAGRLVAVPATLDFGEVVAGRDRRRRFVLTNRGRARLTVRSARLEGGDRDHFRIAESTCAGPLVPGASCSISVTFLPRAPGKRSVRLVLKHDGDGDTLRLPVTGRAAAPPRPQAAATPALLDFGPRPIGTRGEIETVSIRNPGNADLELLGLRLGGPHAGDFQLVPGSCAGASFIAAGSSCTVGVRFIPTATGRREARLELNHRADGTKAVGLVGEGL